MIEREFSDDVVASLEYEMNQVVDNQAATEDGLKPTEAAYALLATAVHLVGDGQEDSWHDFLDEVLAEIITFRNLDMIAEYRQNAPSSEVIQ